MLVPINQSVASNEFPEIFEDDLDVSKVNYFGSDKLLLNFDFTYKSNIDRQINVRIRLNDQIVHTKSVYVLAGFGNTEESVKLSFIPENNMNYTLELSFTGTDNLITKKISL